MLAATISLSAAATPQLLRKATAGNSRLTERVKEMPARVANAPAKQAKPLPGSLTRKAGSSFKLGAHAALNAHGKSLNPLKAVRPVAHAAAGMPTIMGSVIFANSWTEENTAEGLYKVPTAESMGFQMVAPGAAGSKGGFEKEGLYYAFESTSFWGMIFGAVTVYDISTGEELGSYGDNGVLFRDAAYDKATGKVYGLAYNADMTGFDLVEYVFSGQLGDKDAAVSANVIAPMTDNWNSIAIDAAGQMYGIKVIMEGDAVTDSKLCKIDKATGAVTEIGSTGHLPVYISGLCIDAKSGRMFWAVSTDTSGYLTEVNLTTGAATTIAVFADGEEVSGLVVPSALAADAAPAAVSNLALSFAPGSRTGKVSFNAPTTLYDGTPAAGALTYEITANGEVVATGSTAFGEAVSADVTVPANGDYRIAVVVKNGVGASPKTATYAFIGTGTPSAPASVNLQYKAGLLIATWPAVTTAANAGYIDPAAVTYRVTRYINGADSTVVANGIYECGFSEEMAEPTTGMKAYKYVVEAIYDGNFSKGTASNTIELGKVGLPFADTFDGTPAAGKYTIIDANNDGKTWTWYASEQAMRIAYNSSKAMDDWMITPLFDMEAGKSYTVKIDVKAQNTTYAERFEVCAGNGLTAAAMTETVIEPTVVSKKTYTTYTGEFVPTASGKYAIGIHGISDADKYYLYIDNISISAGEAPKGPAAPALTVTPDASGALTAAVKVVAPTLDKAGNPLTALTKIEVAREGNVIKTINTPAPGAVVEFTDNVTENGYYTYTATAYAADGTSPVAKSKVFVGTKRPAAPATVTAVEDLTTDGLIHFTWSDVTTNIDGEPIDPSTVTYAPVIKLTNSTGSTSWHLLSNELIYPAGTGAASVQVLGPDDDQDFYEFGIAAINAGGNILTAAAPCLAGPSYAGLAESFAGKSLSYVWGIGDKASDAGISLLDENSGIAPQDNDGGFIGIKTPTIDSYATLLSGKINLAGIAKPTLRFYLYGLGSENNTNEVTVQVREVGGEWADVLTGTVQTLAPDTSVWNKVSVNLAPYAGKRIQFSVKATAKAYIYTFFDNFKVFAATDKDLAISAIDAPKQVAAGSDYSVKVAVKNNAVLEASNYTVDLYANGEKVDSKSGAAIASEAESIVEFTRTMSALASEEDVVSYTATVNYEGDEVMDNNTSAAAAVVAPKVSKLPKVTNLNGEQTAEGNKLTWAEPSLEFSAAEPVTESFESAQPVDGKVAYSFEGWTLVDGDGYQVGGFQNMTVPGMDAAKTFFVWDNPFIGGNETFAAHSGDKYLACMYASNANALNDWAISPELSGDAQTIKFFAQSYSADYAESIEMYYSNGSLNTADFVKVSAVASVPGDWTEYTFNIPAGAKYFAIRCTSADKFMLMLDDFTYTPAAENANLSIIGYNVYDNGVKLTAEPVAECEYLHKVKDGKHSYVVTAVFDKGESAPCAPFVMSTSGIADMLGAISVKTAPGKVVVFGAADKKVQVVAADGKVVYSAEGTARTEVSLLPGVYVVKAGSKIAKVVVK